MGYEPSVINGRQTSSWTGISSGDAREWWRDHPGATFTEFADWVYDDYEPHIFRSGFGWRPGKHARMTALEREILDDVHAGLAEATEVELVHRRARRREGEDVAA